MIYQASLSNVNISCCGHLSICHYMKQLSWESHNFYRPTTTLRSCTNEECRCYSCFVAFQRKNDVKRLKINWLIIWLTCDGEVHCNNGISDYYLSICIWTNKMHKILVIRLYFLLDALHVSDYISPSSGATFISCTSNLVLPIRLAAVWL